MSTPSTLPAGAPTIGTALGGGYFAGIVRAQGSDQLLSVIVSPREGAATGPLLDRSQKVTGADSFVDGLANTLAYAEAGSALAQRILALRIGGFDDWHIPARDVLELLYRHFKPTTYENATSFRDGDNASSVPAGYAYTDELPAQTSVEAFKEGGDQALPDRWHWSSTQAGSGAAWSQYFGNGLQGTSVHSFEGAVRAVRLIPFNPSITSESAA